MRRITGLTLALALAAGAALAGTPLPAAAPRHVLVIAFENTDRDQLYGNSAEAPFLNGALLTRAARALNFIDPLPLAVPSEPHYVLMEAGTRDFPDHRFENDADPAAANSTAATSHLVTQLEAAGLDWATYQQSQDAAEHGACPVHSDRPYAAKHNPFVFFQDVSGLPPARDTARCAAHHRPYDELLADAAAGRLPAYTFVTPDLCHDMHERCGFVNRIRRGDRWAASMLPALEAWAQDNNGLILLVWDEGQETNRLPFFALGPAVRAGTTVTGSIDHRSLLRTVEELFNLPPLPAVKDAASLKPFLRADAYPITGP